MALGKGRLSECLHRGTRQRGFLIFLKNFLFVECLHRGTRQRHFKKKYWIFAERRVRGTRQSIFQKKIFAECLTAGTQQRRTWPNTVTRGSLCRVPRFCREPGTRQISPLPSALFCRVQFFAECPIFNTRQSSLHSAKALFPVVCEGTRQRGNF